MGRARKPEAQTRDLPALVLRARVPLSPPRRGAISVWMLATLPIMVGAFALGMNTTFLRVARQELHNSADASALAAGKALVDDRMLLNDPQWTLPLLLTAQNQAVALAGVNFVLAQPQTLQLPPDLSPPVTQDWDLVFGHLDQSISTVFMLPPAGGDLSTINPFWFNAIRVVPQRNAARGTQIPLPLGPFTLTPYGQAAAAATAMLDRAVVGFQSTAGRVVPLVPIALSAADWTAQLPPPDALIDSVPQVVFRLRTTDAANPDTALLQIGTTDWEGFGAQVQNGVTGQNLANFGAPFVFDDNNQLTVPGSELVTTDAMQQAELVTWLNGLQSSATPRIWPLYGSVVSGQVSVTGWVAARVVQVQAVAGGLDLTLQPCVLTTFTAVTNPTWLGADGQLVVNRYISKVRLVQ